MRKPDFFIVGAPRCGTTALHSYLADHPQIFLDRIRKEFSYFGSDLHQSGRVRRYTQEEYLRFFAHAPTGARVGEGSVLYFCSQKAAAEIREFNPSAKIIIMLRDPVDMMYSLHGLLVFYGWEHLTDFEAALNAEEERKLGRNLPDRFFTRESLFYRHIARFTEHVSRYFDVFGRENVHVIIFDDFVKDTASVYADTLRFLDVNPEFRTSFRPLNAHPVPRSRLFQSFLNRQPASLRTLTVALLGERVFLRCWATVRRLNTVHRPRPPLDPDLRARLTAEFRPEVERLSELLGRDLTSWCPAPASKDPARSRPGGLTAKSLP
jgi:hypothetical protein